VICYLDSSVLLRVVLGHRNSMRDQRALHNRQRLRSTRKKRQRDFNDVDRL
jgi:hypothetical protein